MPSKKNIVKLTVEERVALEKISTCHHHSVREKKRVRVLLLSDTNVPREEGGSLQDQEIATSLKISAVTVAKVRLQAQERSPLGCIKRQEQLRRKARALDGAQEAHLVALTCSAPPQGAARWTLTLLRERLIEMELVENIGTETIRRTLKKTNSSPG